MIKVLVEFTHYVFGGIHKKGTELRLREVSGELEDSLKDRRQS
jgi:hypothetical protein